MDNQHQKIKGYRDLSQAEIDLMNEIKAHEAQTIALVGKVRRHILSQRQAAHDVQEMNRLENTEPERWLNIARTDLQTGFMSFIRAVAQPTTPWE